MFGCGLFTNTGNLGLPSLFFISFPNKRLGFGKFNRMQGKVINRMPAMNHYGFPKEQIGKSIAGHTAFQFSISHRNVRNERLFISAYGNPVRTAHLAKKEKWPK